MKKLVALLFSVCFVASSNAALIVSQIGDMDGFGIGVNADEAFDWNSVVADADGTDGWFYGPQSFSLSYTAPVLGDIISATLELFTGGQGYQGPTDVLLDNQGVGTLTNGDGGGNFARLDIFDLSGHFALLDGSNDLTFNILASGDGWVLDYAKLTIEVADNNSSPKDVPEPAPLALLAIGLLAAGFMRKKQR